MSEIVPNKLKIEVINNSKRILEVLEQEELDFTIKVKTDLINFNPKLPKEVQTSIFNQIFNILTISNYTKTTFTVDNNDIKFEAGFGPDNIGSVVTIPIRAIREIYFENKLLNLNVFSEFEIIEVDTKTTSMNVFAKNSANKRFFNK